MSTLNRQPRSVTSRVPDSGTATSFRRRRLPGKLTRRVTGRTATPSARRRFRDGSSTRPPYSAPMATARIVFAHASTYYGSTEQSYVGPLLERLDRERFEVWLVAPDATELEPLRAFAPH